MKALIALVIAVSACALPRELVVPEYSGGDAAIVHICRRPSNIMDWYVEVNGEVAATVPDGGSATVRMAPGEKVIYSRMAYNTVPQSVPLKITLYPGGVYYMFQDMRWNGFLLTVPVTPDECSAVQKNVSTNLSK